MGVADLHRIRFVTRRYRQLRGLHRFASGGCLSVYLAVRLLAGEPWPVKGDALGGLLFMVMVCLPAAFAHAYLTRYYRERFGRVGASDDEDVSWDAGMLIAIGFVVMVLLIEALAAPLVLVAMWASVHLWVVVRDYPFRVHHVAGVAAATLVLALPSIRPGTSAEWQAAALLIYCATFALLGLLDHRLLVRAMPGDIARDLPAAGELAAEGVGYGSGPERTDHQSGQRDERTAL